jgi:Tat protein secretion system quality control protein TatD with DNase activity
MDPPQTSSMTDCHAHLGFESLSGFETSLSNLSRYDSYDDLPNLRVLSNSVDIFSSEKNLELGRKLRKRVYPFVGIHPEVLKRKSAEDYSIDTMESKKIKLEDLVRNAAGIGEIGMDPAYGKMDIQKPLFEIQLGIAEATPSLPICIHNRNYLAGILDILSTFQLRNKILFHWFSDPSSELSRLQSSGYFASFGPAIIYSKRTQGIFYQADDALVMAETDSPVVFGSLDSHPVTPFALTSVIFKMSQIRKVKFQEMLIKLENNVNDYLRAQNSC